MSRPSQKSIPVFRPHMDQEEIDAVTRVIKSGWIGLGPETEALEKNLESYLDDQYVITTNSATAALHLALISAGVGPGDEVISPSITFVSTNHVILYQGATPVFCDVDEETLCADQQDILSKITSKTKAIIVVHYGGHSVDMEPLLDECKKKNIILIEDAAHALGGYYKDRPLGTIGDYGCYSFHAVKGLAMADGGAVFTKDKKTTEKIKRLRWMGISRDTWKRTDAKTYSWEYDVTDIGFKYHTNDILAALGNVQLRKLDKVIQRKALISQTYSDGLKDLAWLQTPVVKPHTRHAHHNYFILTDERNRLSDYLADKGIATTVHYVPNHHYSMYKDYSANVPVTERVWKRILNLPLHAELTDEDVAYIIETIRSFT